MIPKTRSLPTGSAFTGATTSPSGAGDGTRTRNLLITNQLLYPLSYASAETIRLATIGAKPRRGNGSDAGRSSRKLARGHSL